MKRTEAERELIALIRAAKPPTAITIQLHENGEWAVCTVHKSVNVAAAEAGIGLSFDEAWRGRKTLAAYQAAAGILV